MSERILIIEDDQSIAELISLYLTRQGYTVHVENEGLAGLQRWQEIQPDLVILDIMLPQVDGWEICHRVRDLYDTPVIVVTARGALADKLHGFDLGVDDYIVKPFDPLELVARTKAVLKRTRNDAFDKPRQVSLPGLTIDMDTYLVTVDGKKVDLTPRETQLLYFLASHPGRVCTREYLLKELWGYDYPGSTRTVDVHINRLRDKVEKDHLPWHIRTVWGIGYRFEVS